MKNILYLIVGIYVVFVIFYKEKPEITIHRDCVSLCDKYTDLHKKYLSVFDNTESCFFLTGLEVKNATKELTFLSSKHDLLVAEGNILHEELKCLMGSLVEKRKFSNLTKEEGDAVLCLRETHTIILSIRDIDIDCWNIRKKIKKQLGTNSL
ncbi:MAG: hypothetical protein OEX08_03240 [Candidatus Nomurabacteria bacterium]|nr:hypothetical protein [Candidatus Nomurabacteria bacterium]